MTGWLFAAMVSLALTGCAGLRQFPDVSKNDDEARGALDVPYQKALGEIYATPPPNAEQQKLIRNKLIDTRVAVIDAHFSEFEAGLAKENVRVEFGIALLGIGVGAA